jgi:hypothetical protein
MSDDIVAELDRWLAHVGNPETTNDARFPINVVQRARDEILALRELLGEEANCSQEFADQVRAEALEEARACAAGFRLAAPHPIGPAFGAGWDTAAQKIAEAIDALKGK